MIRRILVATAATALALASLPALASSPVLITHEGRLLDAQDRPVNDAVTIAVTLYSSKDGSDLVWTETYPVTPADGEYSLVLGDTTGGKKALSTDDASGDRWLGVAVNGVELSPRLRVGTVPTAAFAAEATHAALADDASSLGGVAADQYALKSDVPSIAADSQKLGGVAAADYALKTDLSTDAKTLESHPASYFLAADAPAVDSAKLGGTTANQYALKSQISTDAQTLQTHPAAYFLAADAQAADAAKLGGTAADQYALKSQISTDAQTLQTHPASDFLAAGATAADSAKLGGTAAGRFVKTDSDANDNVTLPGTLTLGGNEFDGSNRHVISYTPSGQTASIQISTDGIYCGTASAPTEGLFNATLPTGGNVNGHRAAKVLCENACSSTFAHQCSAMEFNRSAQVGAWPVGVRAWLDVGVYVNEGGSPLRDCVGWTSNSGSEQGIYSVADLSGPGSTPRFFADNAWCNTSSMTIACCK